MDLSGVSLMTKLNQKVDEHSENYLLLQYYNVLGTRQERTQCFN